MNGQMQTLCTSSIPIDRADTSPNTSAESGPRHAGWHASATGSKIASGSRSAGDGRKAQTTGTRMIRETAAVALVAALTCAFSSTASGSDDPLHDLLEQWAKQLKLDTFCSNHQGHPRCKKLEELRAFCATNPMDTSRCHTSAAKALTWCDSQSSEDRAYCAGSLDAEVDQGAAPQWGPPIVFSGASEPPEPTLRCVPAAVLRQPEQIRILFVREAYQHPEMLHLPKRQLLFYALAKAFPCPASSSAVPDTAQKPNYFDRFDPPSRSAPVATQESTGTQPDDWVIPPKPEEPPATTAMRASATVQSGTGFFVAEGLALTNAHVVTGCSLVRIGSAEQMVTALVVTRDENNDLALLRTAIHLAPLAQLRLSIRQGETVAAYGYPLPGLLASGGNLTTGNIAALSGIGDDSRLLQISVPVQPGNSGGPLLDSGGNVVGVVEGKINAIKIAAALGDIPQNVNFAIKASVIATFLDSNGVHYATRELAATRSPADIAEDAKRFTMRVECGASAQ